MPTTRFQFTPSKISDDAKAIWEAGVGAVDAASLVRQFVRVSDGLLRFGGLELSLEDFRDVVVVGAGKAAGPMAVGLEDAISSLYETKTIVGHVNVPDYQVTTTLTIAVDGCRPAGINLPTERVLKSTEHVLQLVRGSDPEDLCICLISGGASALLEKPAGSITLADFQAVTQLLSHAGATIEELNSVRREISLVKAGGLARECRCRRMITLIVSDVIGDPVEVIGSGPTVIASETNKTGESDLTPMAILKKYAGDDLENVPDSVSQHLRSKSDQRKLTSIEQTSTTPPALATGVHNFVIGNNETAVSAARAKAIKLGYQCEAETNLNEGDVEQTSQRLSRWLRQTELPELPKSDRAKRCLVSGGEPTVNLNQSSEKSSSQTSDQTSGKPIGLGGRNQHLVLSLLQSLLQQPTANEFCILSGGTDGEDGNVDVAGALFDSNLVTQIRTSASEDAIGELLNQIEDHRLRHDSHRVLDSLNCLLRTAPTRTNVCDLRIVLSAPGGNCHFPVKQC